MDKRIIEETPSSEVLNDDWFLKDSPTNGTTKILGSDLKNAFTGDTEDSIDKILSSIALRWSPTTTYGYDAYVIYEGELWRCFKDTGSTRGEFKTSEWIKGVTSGYITHVIEKIANRFVASTPPYMTYVYSVGDMVFYSEPYHDEQLYVCNTDLPQGESTFNPEHWDVVYTVAGLSKYLMDKIAEAGQIDDVQVKTTGDYESVVDENKVAKIDLSNMLIEKSVPNLPQPIATFNDGSDLPLKSLTASIVPVQAGSGDPSPTNVRPISGWNAVDVTRCGENLWGGETLGQAIVDAVNYPSNTYLGEDADGKYVTFSAGVAIRNKVFSGSLKFKENTRYSFVLALKRDSSSIQANASNLIVQYTDGTEIQMTFPTFPTLGVKTTFVYITEPNKTVACFKLGYYSGKIYMYYEESGVFEGVLTAEDFEPYNGHTYTIPFTDSQGQSVEVFDGSVDVVNGGEQPRTLGKITFDGSSDENWIVQGTAGFYIDVSDKKVGMGNYIANNYMATNSSGWDPSTPVDNFSGHPTISRLYFRYPYEGFSADLTAWRTWLASNNVTVVYELATPTTFYTQPTSIKSLDGENNVRASTGDVTKLEYIANATDVIANLEARVTALENQ